MDVSVLELCKTQPKKKWYQITTKDGKLAGEICMSASFVPALIFTFLEAKALHDSNVIAKMDPFVKASTFVCDVGLPMLTSFALCNGLRSPLARRARARSSPTVRLVVLCVYCRA